MLDAGLYTGNNINTLNDTKFPMGTFDWRLYCIQQFIMYVSIAIRIAFHVVTVTKLVRGMWIKKCGSMIQKRYAAIQL